jgi:hypothetical protein
MRDARSCALAVGERAREARLPDVGTRTGSGRMSGAEEPGRRVTVRWLMRRRSLRNLAVTAAVLLAAAPAAASAADLNDPVAQWLPSSDGAEWTYAWSDSAYSPAPRQEQFRVTSRSGSSFRLSWKEVGLGPGETPAVGLADFRNTDAGLVNTNYQSTQPPAQFPVLCETATQCGNSLAGTLYLLIWGTRSPLVSEPLVRGTRWSALGGAGNDVVSTTRYLGRSTVVVPAFPNGVQAARLESDITQAGALGDPFGSGRRTVYWVYGVGPVRVVFQHAGGEVSQSDLQSTSLQPLAAPSDRNLLPLTAGSTAKFRWRNSKHMKQWSRQQLRVGKVINNTARVDVKRLSGPIRVTGSYVLATRLSGITALSSATRGSTQSRLPALGPRNGTDGPRHFYTPYDLMLFGFNPVLPAYAQKGDIWRSSRVSRDWSRYGVTGVSRVLGSGKVKTPAGKFTATVVRSTLRQAGHPFGSGTRTSWFVPGRGLVKLEFRHGDGSVSTVERIG